MNNYDIALKKLKAFPAYSLTESALAIEKISGIESENRINIVINFTYKFEINVLIKGDTVRIDSPGIELTCGFDDLVNDFSCAIYEANERLCEERDIVIRAERGTNGQIVNWPPYGPPGWMDLPTWDDENKRWHDAEC